MSPTPLVTGPQLPARLVDGEASTPTLLAGRRPLWEGFVLVRGRDAQAVRWARRYAVVDASAFRLLGGTRPPRRCRAGCARRRRAGSAPRAGPAYQCTSMTIVFPPEISLEVEVVVELRRLVVALARRRRLAQHLQRRVLPAVAHGGGPEDFARGGLPPRASLQDRTMRKDAVRLQRRCSRRARLCGNRGQGRRGRRTPRWCCKRAPLRQSGPRRPSRPSNPRWCCKRPLVRPRRPDCKRPPRLE